MAKEAGVLRKFEGSFYLAEKSFVVGGQMNAASSRSHCVFTIAIESRPRGAAYNTAVIIQLLSYRDIRCMRCALRGVQLRVRTGTV